MFVNYAEFIVGYGRLNPVQLTHARESTRMTQPTPFASLLDCMVHYTMPVKSALRLGVFTFHSGGFIPTCSMVQQNLRTQAPPIIRPKLRLNLGQWFSSFNSTTSRFLSKPINPAKMESLFWLLMACHDWCTRGISRLSCLEYPIRLGHFCAIGQTNQLLENYFSTTSSWRILCRININYSRFDGVLFV